MLHACKGHLKHYEQQQDLQKKKSTKIHKNA